MFFGQELKNPAHQPILWFVVTAKLAGQLQVFPPLPVHARYDMSKVKGKKRITRRPAVKVRGYEGFTLIELLISITIIGVLIGLSLFGLTGARKSSRDAQRKANLELIRSGLEIYKADCDIYPASLGVTLVGDDSTPSCSSSNTYISAVPVDVLPGQSYYYGSSGSTYELCATLEKGGSDTCVGGCATCNYRVVNP